MKNSKISIIAALFLSSTFFLPSCGGEPAGEHTPPDATQGDYLGDDDLEETTDTDTTLLDEEEPIQ